MTEDEAKKRWNQQRLHVKQFPVGEWPPMGFALAKTMTKAEMLETYPSQPTDTTGAAIIVSPLGTHWGKDEAAAILAHKRAVKAAQMRRYRAKKAGK